MTISQKTSDRKRDRRMAEKKICLPSTKKKLSLSDLFTLLYRVDSFFLAREERFPPRNCCRPVE